MSLSELQELLKKMATDMDLSVDKVNIAATETQKKVYEYLIQAIERFEIANGRYLTGQDYTARFAAIERYIYELIGEFYNPYVRQYLNGYSQIQADTIYQHKEYNKIDIKEGVLDAVRRSLYRQSAYYLTDGLADAYVQPAKFLMMQQVVSGGTINDMRRLLKNWDNGTLDPGKLASDRHAPRLQAYATQIARDTIFTYQGTMQEVIRQEYGLDKFIYVGGIIKDSRPFCRHLISLRRKITLEEIPPLVQQFPEGLKPNTTKKNFFEVRGGYGCRHTCMAVK